MNLIESPFTKTKTATMQTIVTSTTMKNNRNAFVPASFIIYSSLFPSSLFSLINSSNDFRSESLRFLNIFYVIYFFFCALLSAATGSFIIFCLCYSSFASSASFSFYYFSCYSLYLRTD